MKGRKGLFLSAKGIRFLWLGMLILFGLGVNPAVAADSRSQLAEVVRTLGYGGAIHSFKNYVLRGVNRETYAITAQKQFEQARKLLLAMQSNDDFSAVDRTELSAIVGVIDQYLDGLNRIKALFEKGWRTEDIDRVVLVDDVPALQALNRLRKKWQWSAFEEMEFQLGYGGAIHHFKNYVLRANDVNHTAALERLLRVQSLLGEMISSPRFNEKQKRDLDAFERVSHAYLEYLPLIERLIRMQRPVAQIDLAVKVNDEPAYAALKSLRSAL